MAVTIRFAEWPAPAHVVAGVTLRQGGCSTGPYHSNNLATHVGDNSGHVSANRAALQQQLAGSRHWQWLNQVHGIDVVKAPAADHITADACYTFSANTVCTVLTADCLPILLCDRKGTRVAAIHAGWRSLCGGVIENTLAAMQVPGADLLAWFGPAIGPQQFEVGDDVRSAFALAACGEASMPVFVPRPQVAGKYLCNIYQLAAIRLQAKGVNAIYGGSECTVNQADEYYSYRRDGVTGRMASFIYLR